MTDTNQAAKNENNAVKWDKAKWNPFYWFGFTAKKATAREFVTLLVLGLVIYVFLHWQIPPRTSLPLEAKLANTKVLIEIIQQQKKVEVVTSEATDNNVVSLDLDLKTVEQWRQELEPFLSERPRKQSKIESNLTKLEKNLTEIEAVNNEKLNINDVEAVQTTLTDLQKSLRGYKLSSSEEKKWWESILWTNEKKWWEVIFWSLFGTLCYLIQQTSDYYLKKDSQPNNNPTENSQPDIAPQESSLLLREGQADTYLERYKPKYYYYLLRSPFYTLIILFVLSGANLDLLGISVSLGSLGTPVFVGLAFILGFANRVTTEQLDLIIAAIFKDAWKRTVRKIDIYPSIQSLKYGESFDFQVVPDIKVNWTIWSKPSIGTIDAATGMYIAPPEPGYDYDDEGNLVTIEEGDQSRYRQVIIRAEREYEPKVSSLALVTLITDETEQE